MVLWPSWACRTSRGRCIYLVSCSNSLIKRWLVRQSVTILFVLSCIVSNAPAGGRLSALPCWSCILGGLRGSNLCSELIPSVTERSTIFVKELSFPQMTPTDDAFFKRNWPGACWNRWAGTGTVVRPVRWLWTLDSSAKIRNKEDPRGLARCLSQFFLMEENINCLEGECSAYLSPMGGLVFIVYVFPNWMVIRIFSYWMNDFLSLSLSY